MAREGPIPVQLQGARADVGGPGWCWTSGPSPGRYLSVTLEHDASNPAQRLSHELGTPLATLRTIFALLEVSEEDAELLVTGVRALDLMGSLITAAAGRTSATATEPQLVSDVQDAAASALRLIQPLAAGRQLQLVLDNPDDSILLCAVDPVSLVQVLLNLLSNAVKFTGADGVVTVTIDVEPDRSVLVVVSDNGPGIPPSQFDSILNDGVRLSRDAALPGSGIGLAVVSEILHAVGSRLELLDNAAPGTSIGFRLDLI